MNNVVLIGRLTHDPKQRTFGENIKVSFSLAVTRNRSKDTVDYIDCTAWSGLAQIIAKHCRKGDKIAIYGEIRQDRYTSQNGVNRTKIIVNAEKMEFFGTKMYQNAPNNIFNELKSEELEIEDDLPF